MYFGTLIVNLILVIAYSKGKMVATPHMKDQMILIMKRDFYKTGQMASFFKKMRIRKGFELIITRWRSGVCIILKLPLSVDMAGTVDPETLRRCLSLWVMYYLTPKFCIVDRNSFVLTDAGKYPMFRNNLGSPSVRLTLIDPLDGVFKARTSFNRPGVYLDLTIQDGLADLTIKPSYIKLNFASKEYVASCTR